MVRVMQEHRQPDDVTEVVLDATRALVGVAARSLAIINDDVSLAQLRVLVLIDERGPQTMGQIATNLAVSPSTVTASATDSSKEARPTPTRRR